jgi:hypothetical protein
MRIIQPRIGGLFASLAASSRFASTVNMKELPYGSWPSPITAKFITSSSVRLGSLSVDKEGELYWLEGRPQEKGRQVVVRYCGEAAKSDRAAAARDKASERFGVDVTPAEANARTRVHEYGGGAYVIDDQNNAVVYSDFASQRLYRTSITDNTDEPLCLTPEATCPPKRYRFADGTVEPGGKRLVCVREDHGPEGDWKPSEVVNEVTPPPLPAS